MTLPSLPIRLSNNEQFYIEAELRGQPPAEASPAFHDDLLPGGVRMGKPSLEERTAQSFEKVSRVVQGIVEDLGRGLLAADNPHAPDEATLELKIGFDAGGNVWVLSGKASATLGLTLHWKRKVPAAGNGAGAGATPVAAAPPVVGQG